ncbi:MAG: ATP-grasp domain-containing protein [Candidatus Krumholzibacteria bacterium]|nr:ATP-grasp domain-containing protein [Candidatus Krumholzibacteria bacterium]
MVILDHPYLSDLLGGTLERLGAPVLRNDFSEEAARRFGLNLAPPDRFIRDASALEHPRIYTNSENAIGWIARHLGRTALPRSIEPLKNKLLFRRMLESEHPGFFFAGIDIEALRLLDPLTIPAPFVVKPSVGFFSMAVRRVDTPEGWPAALVAIEGELARFAGMYPGAVFDPGMFIIEQAIPGEEYAVDVYYDAEGSPVIVNVLHHLFRSGDDVSDTTYVTSRAIVERGIRMFTPQLARIGELAGLRNFPMHIELRVDGRDVVPIEANPMRFAGFGGTDIAWFAWGINTHELFLAGARPDWEAAFAGRENKVYSMFVGFVPEEVDLGDVERIDYDGFLSNFSKPLELRRTDWRTWRVFAFVFSETGPDTAGEIERNLAMDLSRYVIMR